jgi:ABC-type multidrug transport system fused ATPase/permease subunit
LVLDKISLDIRGGERVGICGRSGCGKSSLLLALLRLVEPESAEGKSESMTSLITIDGVDVCSLPLSLLRSRLTVLPQDPVLYSGTVRSNLDPFGSASDEQLQSALIRAHVFAAVDAAGGLDAAVSEGGSNFSVGQRAQLCLARALVRRTRILVLDEATASLDLETDAQIQRTIRESFADCTILTVAHRLSTIMDYDRVAVLERGRLRDFDTPANLLRNEQSGLFDLVRDTPLVSVLRTAAFAAEVSRNYASLSCSQ